MIGTLYRNAKGLEPFASWRPGNGALPGRAASWSGLGGFQTTPSALTSTRDELIPTAARGGS